MGVGRTIAIALADSGREQLLEQTIADVSYVDLLQSGNNLVIDKKWRAIEFSNIGKHKIDPIKYKENGLMIIICCNIQTSS